MNFEGCEGPFSQSKSIKSRFQVKLTRKCAPRRLKTAPRRPQDAPRFPTRPQDAPKTRPRRSQYAPRPPQDASGAENFGFKNGFLADPLQTSILDRLGLHFGRFWHRFWEVLRWIFRRFSECLGHRLWKFFCHPKGSQTHKQTKENHSCLFLCTCWYIISEAYKSSPSLPPPRSQPASQTASTAS